MISSPVRGHPGVCALLLAPVIKAPQLVVPGNFTRSQVIELLTNKVGEILYISKVSEREELLPFAVGLLGLPGM